MYKLIILDIDETLIHSTYEKLNRKPDIYYKNRGVYLRPGLSKFIQFCFDNFDVAIWTSAKAEYAKYVLKRTVENFSNFKFILTRANCDKEYVSNGFFKEIRYIKDLRKIEDYKLENILMIDDTPQNVIPIDNVISINEYRGEFVDKGLTELQKKLIFFNF